MKTYRTGADGHERVNGFHSTAQLFGLDTLADRRMSCDALALDNTSVICQIQVHAILEGTGRSGPLWNPVLEEFENVIARLENRLSVCCLPAPQATALLSTVGTKAANDSMSPLTVSIGAFSACFWGEGLLWRSFRQAARMMIGAYWLWFQAKLSYFVQWWGLFFRRDFVTSSKHHEEIRINTSCHHRRARSDFGIGAPSALRRQ